MPLLGSWGAGTHPGSARKILLLWTLDFELVRQRVRNEDTVFQAVTMMAAEQ